MERGLIDADLGSGLFKKRIARSAPANAMASSFSGMPQSILDF
ncbi:hypothetical protein [Mitsuaria sp. TWR114]